MSVVQRPLNVTLFVNDELGVRVANFLLQEPNTRVSRVIVNDPPKRRLAADLSELSERWGVPVLAYSDAWDQESPEAEADSLGVSVLFGHILSGTQLALFSRGVLNCHPSLLPHNRGAFPAAWSILESTPSGVTIHLMDEGLDTGQILFQEPVEVLAADTSGTLYSRTLEKLYEVFTKNWAKIRDGSFTPRDQVAGGSYHSSRSFHEMREFRLGELRDAEELLLRLRASSLLDGTGARVTLDSGEVVEVRIDVASRS